MQSSSEAARSASISEIANGMTLETIDRRDGREFGKYIEKLNSSDATKWKNIIPPRFMNHRPRIMNQCQLYDVSPGRTEEPKELRI